MRKKQSHNQDEGGGANWMDTYGDLVTLLLCFFVLLFSFSTIDAQKWEQLVKSFSGASGIMENFSPVGPEDPNGIVIPVNTRPSNPKPEEVTSVPDPSPTPVPSVTPEPTPIPTPEPTATPTPVPTKKPTPTVTPIPAYVVEMAKLSDEIANILANSNLSAGITIERGQTSIRIRLVASVIFEPGSDQLKPEATGLLKDVSAVIKPYAETITSMHTEGHTDSVTPVEGDMTSKWDLAGRRSTRVLEVLLAHSTVSPSLAYTQGFGDQRPIASNDTEEGRDLNNREIGRASWRATVYFSVVAG